MPLALKSNCSRHTSGVGLCHADAQVHMRAIQARAVAYLRKPVDEQDFLQAIQHSLGPQVPEP